MEPRPPVLSPPKLPAEQRPLSPSQYARAPLQAPLPAELPSELLDVAQELAALRGGVDAAIWEGAEEIPPPPPPPKRRGDDLASTEHLVNVLADLSDARDSFAAAWDAKDEEEDPAPPPPPPRSQKLPRPTPAPRRVPANRAADAPPARRVPTKRVADAPARRVPTSRTADARRNRAADARREAAAASRARRERAAQEVEARRLKAEARRTAVSPTTQRRRANDLASTNRREASNERRRALQEAALQEACPFRPRTNVAPATVTAADGRRASKRLHQEATLRREAQLQKRRAARQLSEEHTFQPTLVASRKTATLVEDAALRRPLHERVAAVERARHVRRDALERRVRAEGAPSFRPVLNGDECSARMARRAAQKMLAEAAQAGAALLHDTSVPPDVAARLAADAWRRSRKRAARIEEAEAQRVVAQQKALDASKPCAGSERLAKNFSSFEERGHARQQAAEEKKQAREAERARQRREQFQFTANARSQQLDGKGKDEGPRVARLYRDAVETEQRKEERRAARDAELTFAPALSAGTKRMVNVKPSNLADATFEGRKEACAKAALKFREKCTFQPAINKNRPPTSTKTDAERRRERDARMESERRRRELAELDECSFQPRMNRDVPREAQPASRTGVPTAVKPVVVRGLARHLELKRTANRLAEEHRTRVHNAFHVPKAEEWRDGRHLTQCSPFELSTSTA